MPAAPGARRAAAARGFEGGAVLRGEFRPGGAEREWCDADVLRSLRRRSLARLRREVEPVPAAALARFLPAWHGVGSESGSLERVLEVVAQLEGVFLPFSILERDVLPARVRGYQAAPAGRAVRQRRSGVGRPRRASAPTMDGWRCIVASGCRCWRRRRPKTPPDEPLHHRIREHLGSRGASFFREIFSRVSADPTDPEVLDALVGPGVVRRGHQ